MGISLYGLTPATTYDALIKTGDNEPLTASLKVLSDGVGTNLPIEASTTGINFTGTTTVGGVAVANTTQVAAKQDTLVSGTNIKTINGTSVLGSGNIVTPTTSPSGVAGAIQFSNGSAFASDASNLFWDDTNNRLGIGTNAPTARAHIKGVGATSSSTSFLVQNSLGHNNLKITDDGAVKIENDFANNKFVIGWPDGSESLIFDYTTIRTGGGNPLNISGLQTNIGSYAGTRLTTSNTGTTIYGSGSTSATTSLLVQNSSGSSALTVKDDLSVLISAGGIFGFGDTTNYAKKSGAIDGVEIAGYGGVGLGAFGGINTFVVHSGSASLGATTANASAIFDITSTTKGFLPPRMTTTQKNAIASPAAGLVVYDNTTNKLCCYNGSTWNDLF